jgi:putative Holliday junction resolvase
MKHFVTLSEFRESVLTANGPLLGIDWGSKKIGLSISDATRAFIFPLGVIKNANLHLAVEKLVKILRERKAVGIVIGNPINLDGEEGASDEAVQKFAETLLQASGLPILFQDERFTTRLVHVSRHHINDKRRTKDDDSASACYILQTALAMLNDGYQLGDEKLI